MNNEQGILENEGMKQAQERIAMDCISRRTITQKKAIMNKEQGLSNKVNVGITTECVINSSSCQNSFIVLPAYAVMNAHLSITVSN